MNLVYRLIDLLPPTFEPNFAPRLNRLFLFLKENRGLSENEACVQHLKSIDRKKYFNKMKIQLRSQLGHSLLASPSSPDNMHRTAYEDCYKDFAVYKTLLMSGKREEGIEIAKNLIPRLKKLEIHTLLHLVANDLLFHYSSIDDGSRHIKKYERLATRQLEIVHAESVIRKYHSRVGLIGNTRVSFTPSIIKEFREAAEATLPYLRFGSASLNRLIYSIVVARYVAEYDNDSVIRYCDEALASFPQNHPNSNAFRFSFMHKKVLALAATGELESAKTIVKEACKLAPVGSFNWHIAFIKRITVCLYAGDYQEAYILYKAHRQQKRPHKNAEAYWKIIYAYLYFLIHAGKIEPYNEERFNLAKFINDMPVHTRDKSGNNISILIIEVIIRMQRDQFGHIIDRIDSIREYARTYTHNPETKRANLFLNMIIRMEAAYFHRSGTETKTKKLYNKLQETPLKIGQNMAIEILPFPVLWELILSMLKDQPRARTVRKRSIR